MIALTRHIADLEMMVEQLPPEEQALFKRLFHVVSTVGRLVAPEAMKAWLEKNFGDPAAVQAQKILKVTNNITLEGALFNELRASRPMECRLEQGLRDQIESSRGDPFCRPEDGTPQDVFGRIRGSHCVTASNVAKYDGFHGLIVFDEHNPLALTEPAVIDYFETARKWADKAHAEDPEAKYYFFLWNCLWKSGASILHGHAQMTLTRGRHYARIEALRRAVADYRREFGGDYFQDLFRVHERLGLGWERDGVRAVAYLTPVKEKEILLWADQPGTRLYRQVYQVLQQYLAHGVLSFNVALCMPPLAPVNEDWSGFPALVRTVDRGDPQNRTADFGAMELFAASVIGTDPFRVAEWFM